MLIARSWELGCCVPKEILGIDGYLQREQPEIESLSLNTGVAADGDWPYLGRYNLHSPASLDLNVFKRLQNLSWTGLRMGPELESLRTILTANCEILRVLELDFIYWDAIRRTWTEHDPTLALKGDDIFNQYILPLSPSLITSGFLALTNLSLTAVTLPSDPEASISAFDFGQLRSLRLHRCPHTPRLLRAIARARLPIKLEVLDVVMNDTKCAADGGYSSLNAFLRSFDSLRRLYILILPAISGLTDHYFESILCHSKNLRRVVYHEKVANETTRTTIDKDLSWARTDFGEGSAEALPRFLQQSNLESLAICDSCSKIRLYLESHAAKQTLKLLHIRRSGAEISPFFRHNISKWIIHGIAEPFRPEDYLEQDFRDHALLEFARWAFGPKGLPNLRVLAFGDFSYDGRYKGKNVLLRRQGLFPPNGFSLTSREDVINSSGIDGPFDFLSACPFHPLYPR